FNGSAGSLFAGSTTPTISSASSSLPASLSSSNDFETGSSLDRPGGNVTGVTNLSVELVQQQVEMLHELVPTATVAAALLNPTFPGSESQSRDLQAAARKL